MTNIKLCFYGCLIILAMSLLICPPVKAGNQSLIDADYAIKIDRQTLLVSAGLSGITTERLYVSFPQEQAGINQLWKRIQDVRVQSGHGNRELPIENLGKGLFEIRTGGESNILLTYRFDTRAAAHNHNVTILTSSYLHIAGEDFFFRISGNRRDAEKGENLSSQNLKIKLDGLPKGWKVLTTFPMTSEGIILVDDVESLIHAGDYELFNLKLDGTRYTIALDRARRFAAEPLIGDLTKIIRHQYQIFHRAPDDRELIVINQSRKKFGAFSYSLGGQVKRANVIMEFGGINRNNLKKFRVPIAKTMAHEIFHLWLTRAFNVTEEWSWFWEGFTEYEACRTLLKTGIVGEREFKQLIAQKYLNYHHLKLKNRVDLIDASTRKFDANPEYGSLVYDKGTLVAYLFDKRLVHSGKNFDGFMRDMYRDLAVPGKPVGNREVVDYLNQYLGDASFTSKYVLGTDDLPIKPLTEFGPDYWRNYLRLPPPPPFPLNFLIPLMALTGLGWIVRRFIRKQPKR